MKKIYYFCLMAFAMLFAAETNATEVEDYSIDWSKQTAFNFWAADVVKPHLSVTADGLQAENTTAMENYLFQYQGASNLGLTKGKDYTLPLARNNQAQSDINFSTEEKAYEVPFTASADDGFVLCQSGAFVGTTTIKSITITH